VLVGDAVPVAMVTSIPVGNMTIVDGIKVSKASLPVRHTAGQFSKPKMASGEVGEICVAAKLGQVPCSTKKLQKLPMKSGESGLGISNVITNEN
jgi:hypothetical protein